MLTPAKKCKREAVPTFCRFPPAEQHGATKKPCDCSTHYVQLQIVSEPMGALHSHQDGVLLLSAEAHGQPVGSGAGPLIGRPGERDERPPLSEDVSGPSWRRRHSEKLQSETIEGTFCCRRAGFSLTRSDGRIQLSWRYFQCL